MEVKTIKRYQKEILSKYKNEKGGELRGYLAAPTRSQIRDACVYLFHRRNEKGDEYILNRFFQFKDDDNKLRQIQNFGEGKFRSIENFLKEEVENTSAKNLNLISWLIDFRPRPYEEYLKSDDSVIVTEDIIEPKLEITKKKSDFEVIGNNEIIQKEKERKRLEEIKRKKKKKRKLIITISIVFGMVLMIFGIQKWSINLEKDKCMTWSHSLYVAVSCDEGPVSKYGTQVKPLDQTELKSMKKVKVDAAYQFFSDTGKPLIWYYKNKDGEYEYFTTPGLHPTTGETLKKITEGIIKKYVPIHVNNKASFIN